MIPKSTSSMVPCAPSASTFFPFPERLFIRYSVSDLKFFQHLNSFKPSLFIFLKIKSEVIALQDYKMVLEMVCI